MEYQVVSLNIGKVKVDLYQGKEINTGIYKTPMNEEIFVSSLQIEGDEQADLENHGGKDKVICMYPNEHYTYWKQTMPGEDWTPGAFGENFTIQGMNEENTCIGDVFEMGEILLQVSLPRQPCYKLANKLKKVELPLEMQKTGYTGFYFRVLREGQVRQGQTLRLVESHPDRITVAYVNQIKYHDKVNKAGLTKLANLHELSEGWRTNFETRLNELEN